MLSLSASLFYIPQNVYSLIRPKTGNGLLIAQPGHDVFLRETFLSHLGDHKLWQWKANAWWLALYGKLFSESNNHPWIQWNIYELPKLHRDKESTCQCRRNKRCGFNPWVREKGSSFPGGGNGNPLQYSCLKNYMDRGAWWATVHGVTESDTTECLSMHTSVEYLQWVGIIYPDTTRHLCSAITNSSLAL